VERGSRGELVRLVVATRTPDTHDAVRRLVADRLGQPLPEGRLVLSVGP
jgi:hypothetical protein